MGEADGSKRFEASPAGKQADLTAFQGNGGPDELCAIFSPQDVEGCAGDIENFRAPLLKEAVDLVDPRAAPDEDRPSLPAGKADVQFVGQDLGKVDWVAAVALKPFIDLSNIANTQAMDCHRLLSPSEMTGTG